MKENDSRIDDQLVNHDFRSNRISLEHLSFFLIILTELVTLNAFWNFQFHIWNRVSYNVGPWTNPEPYLPIEKYPTSQYIGDMLDNIILMLFMNMVFVLAILAYIRTIMSNDSKLRTLGVLFILTGIMHLIMFWSLKSIELSPNNWLQETTVDIKSSDWKFVGIELPSDDKFNLMRQLMIANVVISGIGFYGVSILWVYLLLNQFRGSDNQGVLLKPRFSISNYSKFIAFYAIMVAFLMFTVMPVIYTLFLSVSSAADIQENSTIPSNPVDNFIINYSSVIFVKKVSGPSFATSFRISLILGFGTAIGGLLISLPAAYAISRFKFKGRGLSQFLVLATQMFPGLILLIPQFLIWKELGY
jgi:ABC-type spermidine/putrescine transport system permease subunit II